MKNRKNALLLLLIGLFICNLYATSPEEKTTYISSGEIIKDNYFWAGSVFDFKGHALKDLILLGKEVNVRGIVEGDVIALAQKIRIEGEVKGNIRAVGEVVSLGGKIGKNATLAGKYVEIPKSAEIGWDLVLAGQRLSIEGKINGDIKGGAGETILGGEIGGSADLKTQELSILPSTHIKGNLIYSAGKEAVIPKEAKIEGKVVYTPPPPITPKPAPKGIPFVLKFLWLLGFLAAGTVLLLLFPRQIKETCEDMISRPGLTMGWGFFVLIATPIGATLIAFSVIGIPLTFITWGLYLIAIYLATPLVGVALGMKILRYLLKRDIVNLYASMGLGIILLYLLKHIPFIGWLVILLSVCWGLGGMQGALGKRIKAGRLGPVT